MAVGTRGREEREDKRRSEKEGVHTRGKKKEREDENERSGRISITTVFGPGAITNYHSSPVT